LDRFQLKMDKDELLCSYEDEIEPYPEVKDALEQLCENFELVVTSNAAREFIDIELEGFEDYFSEIFSATSDFREVKKSPLLYGAVCAHLKAQPCEVIHIGDHYSYDYESPLQAGLDALFLDRKGNRTGSEVVGDLREAAWLICGST
jgi:putative hydrolase of the HAD superfamily